MSCIHFTSTEKYSNRVIQMGEKPENVFCFGAPGLDNIHNLKLMSRENLSESLKIPNNVKLGIVTYHPVTLEKDTAGYQISELLKALTKRSDIYWIFTMPNSDTGGRIIIDRIKDFVSAYPGKGKFFTSLGQLRYLSLTKHAELMVGNSSSGIIEAPSFGLPVVNIGNRQTGRVRAQNVIDVEEFMDERISDALEEALSTEFKGNLKGMTNPYGEGNSSEKIVDVLKNLPLDDLIKKQFQDMKNTK
jgi:GDP/UDP-N,N'-diacetylbacillosamine 2-epimerase (hydrolysing)